MQRTQAVVPTTDEFTFALSKDGLSYTLTGTKGRVSPLLVVPATHDGLPVTAIGEGAFRGRVELTSVLLPEGISSIGQAAFYGCYGLTSVTLPEGVTTIEFQTFYACTSLKSITLPNSVTSLSPAAFSYCARLTDATLSNNLTAIGYQAFYGCTSLKRLTLPDGVIDVGYQAFFGCEGIIEKEWGVFYVDRWAIDCSDEAAAVLLRNDTKGVATAAFCACKHLTRVYYEGGEKAWKALFISPAENEKLSSATKYFYSNNPPTEGKNYWRYVDGIPTAW